MAKLIVSRSNFHDSVGTLSLHIPINRYSPFFWWCWLPSAWLTRLKSPLSRKRFRRMKPFLAGNTLLATGPTVTATATIDALMATATDIGRTATATSAVLSFFEIPSNKQLPFITLCFWINTIENMTLPTFFN